MYIVHLFYYFTSLFRRRAANRPPSSRIFSFAARRLLFSRMFPSAARRLPSSRIFRPLLDAHYLAKYSVHCQLSNVFGQLLFPTTYFLIRTILSFATALTPSSTFPSIPQVLVSSSISPLDS